MKELLASGKVKMDADKGDRPGPIAIGAAVAARPSAGAWMNCLCSHAP